MISPFYTDRCKHEEKLQKYLEEHGDFEIDMTPEVDALMSYMYLLGWADGSREAIFNKNTDNLNEKEIDDFLEKII